MSRIGKKIIPLADKVKITLVDGHVTVEGPKGKLSMVINPNTSVDVQDKTLVVSRKHENKGAQAAHGMMRAVLHNMVTGVSTGFQKILDINGVGYRAEVKGDTLHLTLGFSHPVEVKIPTGIKASVDKQTTITMEAIDKELLGQFAANVRKLRPPEPYKGKGIKYREEVIIRKVGKSAGK